MSGVYFKPAALVLVCAAAISPKKMGLVLVAEVSKFTKQ
jgi:hypothetical protein